MTRSDIENKYIPLLRNRVRQSKEAYRLATARLLESGETVERTDGLFDALCFLEDLLGSDQSKNNDIRLSVVAECLLSGCHICDMMPGAICSSPNHPGRN